MEGFDSQYNQPRQIPWKKIAILAGIVLACVLVIVGVVWFLRSRAQKLSEFQHTTQQIQTAIAECDTAANQEACKQQKIEEAAARLGQVDVCKMLEGDAYNTCVWQTARAESDPKMCAEITDSAFAAQCADDLNVKLALASSDVSYCNAVKDDNRKNNCTSTLAGPVTSANCASRGYDAAYCEDIAVYESALAARDPNQCAGISDTSVKANCEDGVGSGDIDNDGLSGNEEASYGTSDTSADTDGDGVSDYDEVRTYGTDPTNADTDGDGYGDNDEINSEHDPLGPG